MVQNVFSSIDLAGAKQAEVDLEEGSLRMSADASYFKISSQLPFDIIAMPGVSAVIEVEGMATAETRLSFVLNKTTMTESRKMQPMQRETFRFCLPMHLMREKNTMMLSM